MAIPFKSNIDMGTAASLDDGVTLKIKRTTSSAPSTLAYGSLGIANDILFYGTSDNKPQPCCISVPVSVTQNVSAYVKYSGWYFKEDGTCGYGPLTALTDGKNELFIPQSVSTLYGTSIKPILLVGVKTVASGGALTFVGRALVTT